MPVSNFRVNGDIAGIPIRSTIFREAAGHIGHGPITLPAAAAGTLSTRSTDTTGVVTVVGLELGPPAVCAIYWVVARLYHVDVDSVDGDAVTFSGGEVDVLPTESDP